MQFNPQPPAGWYPDASGQPFRRYWDGTRWTSATDQPEADDSDDGPIDLSLDEYLNYSFQPDSMAVTQLVRRHIAGAATQASPEQRAAFTAVLAAVFNLELEAVNMKADAYRTAAYVLDLEQRIRAAGVALAQPPQSIRFDGPGS